MPRNRDVSLYNRYRYFVSDYDLKQYVKTFFFKTSCFYFLEHAQDFLRLQSVAQPGERGYPGAYLGGAIVPWIPPFGSPGLQICIEKRAKLRHAPLCKLGKRFDHTKAMFYAFVLGFGRKFGSNLSEDIFFCSSPDFGRNNLIQTFALLTFSEVSGPPPFSKSCVRYGGYQLPLAKPFRKYKPEKQAFKNVFWT